MLPTTFLSIFCNGNSWTLAARRPVGAPKDIELCRVTYDYFDVPKPLNLAYQFWSLGDRIDKFAPNENEISKPF
jgi:hypothetical protein